MAASSASSSASVSSPSLTATSASKLYPLFNSSDLASALLPEGTKNPAFQEWHSSDRLLVGWLRNTMTQEISAQLLHCKTARDLWLGEKDLTCATTKSRIMGLKSELIHTRKNSMKMDECLAKMKNIADQLAITGAPLPTEDLILHTLDGLDIEYNPVVVKLADQDNLSWVSLQSQLMSYESRMEKLTRISNLNIQASANAQLYKTEPDYKSLQPFGCACYPCLKAYNVHKFQFHSQKCIYLGLAAQQKGYKCMSSTGKIYVSRHAVFDSHTFPNTTGFLNRRNTAAANEEQCIIPFVIQTGSEPCDPQASGSQRSRDGEDVLNGASNDGEMASNASGQQSRSSSKSPTVISSTGRLESRDFLNKSRDMASSQSPANRANIGQGEAQSEAANPIPLTNEPEAQHEFETIRIQNQHPMITRARDGIYKPRYPFVGNDSTFLKNFIRQLNATFALKDLGDLYYFLGIEVYRDNSAFHLCQAKYTLDILKKFDMVDCAPVMTPMFGGSPVEDHNNHILNFLEICDTFKHNDIYDDAILLKLFPFSLRDKAKIWLHSLPEGSITTSEGLAQHFLKYFPPGKTAKLRNDITFFVHFDNENLYEAWERFKDLLIRCPHHGLPKWLQVQTFYNGLSPRVRTFIDAAAGGALMSKPVDDAYTLLETMSSNNHQWHSHRNVHARLAGIQDSDIFAFLSSQIAALTKEVKSLSTQGAVKAGEDSLDCWARVWIDLMLDRGLPSRVGSSKARVSTSVGMSNLVLVTLRFWVTFEVSSSPIVGAMTSESLVGLAVPEGT
ncbi:uncharacterized protein G2W53_004644 [Senna tora]|uniref:Retrotransposon gag domain-containing protein n=1 Tax=Senna tora TaxID=362788 RepID=A0A834XE18_9FABA|nr:uncharacterized protein G2W53_004644 [Senna tora]